MTFFTMFINPFSDPTSMIGRRPSQFWLIDIYGVSSILGTAALTMGVILFALRRWKLPVGSITLILTLNSLLMFWLNERGQSDYRLLLLVAPIIGLLADAMLYFLKPSPERPLMFRAFSFIIPFAYYLLFLGLLNQVGAEIYNQGLWWKIHMWLGVPILAGVVGVFLSYLTVPPALPISDL